jgi:hypothetical protein
MNQKMEYWKNKFVKKYMQKIELEPGDYIIDMDSETQLLAKRNSEQSKQERFHISRAASLYGTPEAPR